MMYEDIKYITRWIDGKNVHQDYRLDEMYRVLAIQETAGKAGTAYVGWAGTGYQQGTTHSADDFYAAVADVAIMALCCLQHCTGNERTTQGIIEARIAQIRLEMPDDE